MKLTVGRKLGLGFGVILLLMISGVGLTYVKVGGIKETQDRFVAVRVPTINALTDMQRDLNQAQSKGRQAILAGNQTTRWESAKKLFDSNWEDIGKDVAKLDELSTHWAVQADRDRLAETKKQLPPLREVQETAIKAATGSDHDAITKAGNQFADQATPITEAIKKPLGEITESNFDLLHKEAQEMNDKVRSMNVAMFAGTLAALAL